VADVNLTDISDALSQEFEAKIIRQVNRKQGLLSILPKVVGAGKNCAWDVEVGGATSAAGADGDDIAEGDYDSDAYHDAVLGWGNYRAAFRVGGQAQAAARTTSSPEQVRNLFTEKMFGSVSKLASDLNVALYTGSGATNNIFGLLTAEGPLSAAGTYATIVRGSVTEWASNELANGGTPRFLTQDLMRSALRAVFNVSGDNCDLIVTDPLTWDLFGALLDTNRRPVYDIQTAGGAIKMQGGWSALEFDGIPVIRDKDCPAGNMLFLCTEHLAVQFLPTYPGQSNTGDNSSFASHDDKGDVSGLPFRIEMIGKAGDSDKAFVKVYPQLKCRRPNAQAWLADIATTLS
jgi:hypothetical protein